MIKSKDRSYYIGASDTQFIVGNWETVTFAKWYGTKQGIYSSDFSNDAMMAGTYYEHSILKALNITSLETDKQIINGRLRVNLDGNTINRIYEVKTYGKGTYKPIKNHIQQVNVQMYGANIFEAFIVSYLLEEYDYINFFNEIDLNRLSLHEIAYDKEFIETIYLPRFDYLSFCLDKGIFPKIEGLK